MAWRGWSSWFVWIHHALAMRPHNSHTVSSRLGSIGRAVLHLTTFIRSNDLLCYDDHSIPLCLPVESIPNQLTSQLHTAMLDNSVTWRLLKLSRKIVKKPISGTPSYRQQFVCFLLYIASHFETARRGIQLSAQWLTFHWENSDAGRWVSAVHLFYDWISQTWRRMSYPMS